MDIYRHRQVGRAMVVWLGVIALVMGFAVYRSTGEPMGAAAVAALMVLTTMVFSSLEVAVTPRELTLAFGPGIIRKRFRVDEIAAARAVRNSWWYGWGIHLTPHGWLYNVAGMQAVELEMRGGKKVRIGSDEPDRLLAALARVSPAVRAGP